MSLCGFYTFPIYMFVGPILYLDICVFVYLYTVCVGPMSFSYVYVCVYIGDVWVFGCMFLVLLSGPVELLIVAVDSHTAVVGDRPGHGRNAGDDARGGVIAQDGVRGLARLSPTAQDEDLPVTNRHSTTLLQRQKEITL